MPLAKTLALYGCYRYCGYDRLLDPKEKTETRGNGFVFVFFCRVSAFKKSCKCLCAAASPQTLHSLHELHEQSSSSSLVSSGPSGLSLHTHLFFEVKDPGWGY